MTLTASPTLTLPERITRLLFLAAVFFVPFATALTTTFAGLTLAGFAVSLAVSPELRRALRAPPALLALALLALVLLGTTWSIGTPADIHGAVRKYLKLLVLPIGICLSMRDPALPLRALKWSLAGIAYLTASTYLVWSGKMPSSSLGWWRIGDASDPYAFKNHITIGILLGFAACACFLKASYPGPRMQRLLALAAGVWFTVPNLFLGQGRTGYVAMLIGLVAIFLLRIRVTPLRVLAGLAAIAALFTGLYMASPNFQSRTDALVAEVKEGNPRSPNGLRMSFMKVGAQAVAENPVAGLGTGAFAEAYAPTARAVWSGSELAQERFQPHSEFMLIAVQFGVIGLALYLGMLAALGRPALHVRSFETDVLAILWLIYVITSTFNSLLWDITEGYWFMLLAGCLYAGAMREHSAREK